MYHCVPEKWACLLVVTPEGMKVDLLIHVVFVVLYSIEVHALQKI